MTSIADGSVIIQTSSESVASPPAWLAHFQRSCYQGQDSNIAGEQEAIPR